MRGKKLVGLYEIADKAAGLVRGLEVETQIVLQRLPPDVSGVSLKPGRDVWWADATAAAEPECDVEWVGAEELFILHMSCHHHHRRHSRLVLLVRTRSSSCTPPARPASRRASSSRDPAEMQPRSGRAAAELQPRCSRDVARAVVTLPRGARAAPNSSGLDPRRAALDGRVHGVRRHDHKVRLPPAARRPPRQPLDSWRPFPLSRYVFDLQPGDVYFCTADCGWITGHSYVTYGPLLNGETRPRDEPPR